MEVAKKPFRKFKGLLFTSLFSFRILWMETQSVRAEIKASVIFLPCVSSFTSLTSSLGMRAVTFILQIYDRQSYGYTWTSKKRTFLKRVIQRQVLNELSKQILSGKVNKGSVIVLDCFDGQVIWVNLFKIKSEVACIFFTINVTLQYGKKFPRSVGIWNG